MKFKDWHRNILCECKDYTMGNREASYCQFGDEHPYWCEFEKCPKIPIEDKRRDYEVW